MSLNFSDYSHEAIQWEQFTFLHKLVVYSKDKSMYLIYINRSTSYLVAGICLEIFWLLSDQSPYI